MRARIDQIPDGFRLKQIELAVQHRATCEFSRLGLARSCTYRRGEHRGGGLETAMGRDFEKVFAREGVWRAIERGDDLVEDMSGLRVDHLSTAGPARLQRSGAKQLRRDGRDVR